MKPRKPLKIPAWAMAPSTRWIEAGGMQRAIAVLKTEAALLKREGFELQPKALLRVAMALAEANRKGGTTGEADSLDWKSRDEAARGEDE